ncbi:hypothetical protein [Halosimplex salinum]|uniref:hypothetical protein n=1 Tax=Halosimplex salinum TaxID=1710538 RepID=UPI000F48F587|nr:hypothetical protein [Halosimplex salinum]
MDRRNKLGTTLAVLAVVLFTVPAFFPVQPLLVHDTGMSTTQSPAELEDDGYEIIAYENLSERGQELYVTALETRGEHRVAVGEGASDFEYLNQTERRAAFRGEGAPGIVIERPEDDEGLPPADEHSYHIPEDENVSEEERQRAETAMRYDMMETSIGEPPLGATPQLIRLASVLFAVLSLGIGGYLLSSK